MKLTLMRETLLEPLQKVIGVVEKKQTLPILSNVLINARDNKIFITGTDLEVELIGQASLESAFSSVHITIPGRKLMDICKALPENAAIELYQEKQRVILRSGHSRFTLKTLPVDDFPCIETKETSFNFNLTQKELKILIQRTMFSMAHQDVRYYLNGMLFEVNASSLRFVATDGHRLALNTVQICCDPSYKKQIIVPRKGVIELIRILNANQEGEVSITISQNHIKIEVNSTTFRSKLIDGLFPQYDKVIPKSGNKIVSANPVTLKAALSRTAILCNEKFKGIRFELRKNRLRILANNPEQEAAEDEITVDYSGHDLDIGFNVNYLLDILNVLDTETIKLTFMDPNSSILVEEPDNKGQSCFVVMPMRL